MSASLTAQKAITYPIGEFQNVERFSIERCADDPFICDLLDKYSPKFVFHPNENFFPSTVDYFLAHSTLRYRYTKKNTKEILSLGEVNGKTLGQQIHGDDGEQTVDEIGKHQPSFRKSRSRGEYYLEVAKEHKNEVHKGFDPNTLDEQLIGYSNYGKLYNGETFMGYQLQYWIFFPNNGSIGYHEGDWEGISVTVDPKGAFVFATYMAHGRSGTYLPEQITFADSIGNEQVAAAFPDDVYSHPVVFISKAMHGSYPDERSRRRWKLFIPLPADKTKRGVAFNSFKKMHLLPNRFNATGNMNWVKFAGRWGGRRTNLFNSPDGPAYKKPYNRGTWFRHKDVKKKPDLRARGNRLASTWARLRFEPRYPVCDDANQWIYMVSRNDLREQYFAEVLHVKDPSAKYHNLDLYNFDNMITGIMECWRPGDTYITFDDVNFGGDLQVVSWSGEKIRKTRRIKENDRISSVCWARCEESNWVSFFKNKDFKGTSYFLNGDLATEVGDFSQTNLGGGEISSIRYCLPEGYKLVLYDQPDFTHSEHTMELQGTGKFSELDFHDSDTHMENVIRSARILSVVESVD